MRRLVIASGNPGKLREFDEMLTPIGFEVLPQSHFGISGAEEPHLTFIENALAKARHASAHANLPAFADDSGICVAALCGAPGVQSARYAATERPITRSEQDRLNNERLVAQLAGSSDREAHYYCVIVLVRHAADPEPLIAEGRWHGIVLDEPRGTNGFGYDPYFFVPGRGRTAAEFDAKEKNALSHRGQALRSLVARLTGEG
jgi:XTP/dITP diphosphohydrolase